MDKMALIQAVLDDDTTTVQELVENGVEVNYIDDRGKSALYYAIEKKNSTIVKLLVNNGADIYLEVSNNDFLADRAIQSYEAKGKYLDPKQKEIVQLIEEKILDNIVWILKASDELEQNYEKTELDKAKSELKDEGLDKAKSEIKDEGLDKAKSELTDKGLHKVEQAKEPNKAKAEVKAEGLEKAEKDKRLDKADKNKGLDKTEKDKRLDTTEKDTALDKAKSGLKDEGLNKVEQAKELNKAKAEVKAEGLEKAEMNKRLDTAEKDKVLDKAKSGFKDEGLDKVEQATGLKKAKADVKAECLHKAKKANKGLNKVNAKAKAEGLDKAEAAKLLNKAKTEVKEKINELLIRLTDRNKSDYKDANTFIRFLETFAFDDDLTQNFVNDLKKEFLKGDHDAYVSICKFRHVLLHSSGTIRSPEYIFDGIRFFFKTNKITTVDKKEQFFDELEQFLRCCLIVNSDNPINFIKISNFFKCNTEDDKEDLKSIVNQGQKDNATNKIIYEKFENLICKAYNNEVDKEEHWFEFNVNIFPSLGIGEKKGEYGDMEILIVRLRNNLVHSFSSYGPEKFEDAIIQLKGKLFEYYCARKLHETLKTSITRKVKEIENEINQDFETLQNIFKHHNLKNSSMYQLKCIVTPCTLQALVEDYFTIMPTIEYAMKHESKTSPGIKVNHCFKFNSLSSRLFLFFNQYLLIKKYKKESDEKNYVREKKELINILSKCGIKNIFVKHRVKKICTNYLEEGKNLSRSVSVVLKKVVEFINLLSNIKNSLENSTLIDIAEKFLRDPTEKSLFLHSHDLHKDTECIYYYPRIQNLVETFTTVKINDIDVDVKATIKTMLKVCNYDFYSLEMDDKFNIKNLFIRETFLNVLLNEEEKLLQDYSKNEEADKLRVFAVINQLMEIDYMAPFIAKLIKHLEIKDSELINSQITEDKMKRLIKNLANKQFSDYLSLIMSVKFVNYNSYQLLYNYIVESLNNLDENKNSYSFIFSIFNNSVDLIEGFSDFLTSPENEEISFDYIEKIIISLLKIINKVALDQICFWVVHKENRFRIENNKILAERLAGLTEFYSLDQNHIKMTAKNEVKIQEKYGVVKEILIGSSEKIEKKFFNKITLQKCHEIFIERDILKARISIFIKPPFDEAEEILKSTMSKLSQCKDVEHRKMHDRYKLLIIGYFPEITSLRMVQSRDCNLYNEILIHVEGEDYQNSKIENVRETYEKIKYYKSYKELLSISDVLRSKNLLNVFHAANRVAFENLHTIHKLKDKDEKELLSILKVFESIYSYYKDIKDTKDNEKVHSLLQSIIFTYTELGLASRAKNNYDKTLRYYLKALVRYIIHCRIILVNSISQTNIDIHACISNTLFSYYTYISIRYDFSKTLTDLDERKDYYSPLHSPLCRVNSTNAN